MRLFTIVIFFLCGLLVNFTNKTSQSALCDAMQSIEIVSGVICGNVAQSATGPARIIKRPRHLKKIKPGDIIVTDMTKESWLPYMKKSSGIITDLGDHTCHAAMYGKTNSIPVLVGAGNATEKINDGHIITINCSPDGRIGRVYKTEKSIIPLPVPSADQVHFPVENNGSSSSAHYFTHNNFSSSYQSGSPKDNKMYISADTFNKHRNSFVLSVLETRTQLKTNRKRLGETYFITMAKWWESLDEIATACMLLSYPFFDVDETDIRQICSSEDLDRDRVNRILIRSQERPGDKNWLAKVSYEDHINSVSLPSDVSKADLMRDPKKYKKLVEKQKIDKKEYHSRIAEDLLARYFFENKYAK